MTGHAFLVPLTVAVPIFVACIVVVIGDHVPRPVVDAVATCGAGAVAALAGWLLYTTGHGRVVMWSGGWQPARRASVGVVFVADSTGAGLALLAGSLMTLALVFGWRFFESVRSHFHALMLLFLAGMEGFVLTGDLFDMFVFFELMGAAAYALTGFKIEDPSALQGAVNFGIINSLGAYVSLTGIGILYARTGQLGLAQLSQELTGRRPDALVVAAFVLVCCGLLVKGAMVPFHYWLADAHAVAPSPVCVLFSGVMVELGLYGVARVFWVSFSGTLPHDPVRQAFVVFATVTAVVGTLMCFAQRHLKRLLAYSTIAHVGLFLFAFAMLDVDGTSGAALYVLGHAGAKAALFLLTGVLLNRYGSVDEVELFGRGRDARVTPWLFLAGGLALAGLPPFGTALGKDIAEHATLAAGYPWAPALFVAVSSVTGAAVLRAGLRVYFGLGDRPTELEQQDATPGEEEAETERRLTRTPATMGVSIAVLLAGSLAVGVLPGLGQRAASAASRLVDRPGYVDQALAHAPATPVPFVPEMHWSTLGLALGGLSTLLAVAIAFAALYARRFPELAHKAVAPFGPPLAVVRKLHSGHVGDYVAWLFLGLAAFGALVGLPMR